MNLKSVASVRSCSYQRYDEAHCGRVAELSLLTAQKLELSGDMSKDILLAAQYHDVGKGFLLKSIIEKPGPLTPEEFEHIKYHSLYSAAVAIENAFNCHKVYLSPSREFRRFRISCRVKR